jgi:hypothetical protein
MIDLATTTYFVLLYLGLLTVTIDQRFAATYLMRLIWELRNVLEDAIWQLVL